MHSATPQISPSQRVAAVAFCTDKFMDAGLHVAASSLLRNLHPEYTARIYLHLTNFSDEDVHSLRKTLDCTGRGYTLHLVDADARVFRNFRPFYGNFTTYHRLLLPEVIHEGRLLYVDSDLLIREDISPLFEVDMGGKPVGFVVIGLTSKNQAKALFTSLGIPPDTPYFNAGVMLMNLPEWRRQSCTERVFAFCREHNAQLIGDETALNGVFAGDFYQLEPKYNILLHRSTVMSTIPATGIYHFLENPKPWDLGGRLLLSHSAIWFEELKTTAFPAHRRFFWLKPRTWLRAMRTRGSYYRTLRWKLLRR
jgi:lipopolysaccharide biosynthesis glycosyltransferase